ncbi:HAMP domain-containing protein [Pontibacillus marinus]|uniref:HAMP domain-containing protein n=1 Tax=Pontibacillus marinus BH030004 = DSM 16465 TaxID=1385511 RepID=A0A0A5I7R9_9BACI|nr:methyl-accepting chemotaxis protein [Pontibacillus marinus]KGX91887.1 hypothetical protein N783_00665 [Pontibacillus marinus BH030004 = DSM 16465]
MLKPKTLRQSFLTKMLSILLIITLLSGVLQLYYINVYAKKEIKNQALMIAENIDKNIEQTKISADAIEHQIDLKLISMSKNITDKLKGKTIDEIYNEDLGKLKDEFNLAGITLFNKTKDDIVGVKSTNPNEIGFSIKKYGYYEAGKKIFNGVKPDIEGATYLSKNAIVLPIAPSGSQNEVPTFFKYAYYHAPGTSYVINIYIEANEVYQYTKETGTEKRIDDIKDNTPNIKEIAVLNPKVFKDPSLEKQLYPPLKKVEYGEFNYKTDDDIEFLKKTAGNLQRKMITQSINNEKVFKVFLPINEDYVVYTSFDYQKLSAPLYRHSYILIATGIISLFVLFLVTARFFNRIYENIQRIKSQIRLLESGNLTAESKVTDNSELQKLSESANRMANTLGAVLKETREQAQKVQQMSIMLEAEASKSVEKMFKMSTKETARSREQLNDTLDFLDKLKDYLNTLPEEEKNEEILEDIENIKQVAKGQTASSTDFTLTLADLLKSLHYESSELSDISNLVLQHMANFKLEQK